MDEGERVGFNPKGCLGALVEIAVAAYLVTRVVPGEYRDLALLGLFGAILVVAAMRHVLAKEKAGSSHTDTATLFGSATRDTEPPSAVSSEPIEPR